MVVTTVVVSVVGLRVMMSVSTASVDLGGIADHTAEDGTENTADDSAPHRVATIENGTGASASNTADDSTAVAGLGCATAERQGDEKGKSQSTNTHELTSRGRLPARKTRASATNFHFREPTSPLHYCGSSNVVALVSAGILVFGRFDS
jgi:hypothetical protein